MKISIKSLYNFFRQHKEATWVMEPQNALLLYQFVKENPIKRVLDLGTGIGVSVSVIALALQDKGETDYEIHTVEQFEKCHKLAQELIPEELKAKITFHLIEPTTWQTEKIPYQNFSVFKDLPAGDFDLVLVDGPGPFLQGDLLVDLPNGDIMKMLLEEKLKPRAFVVWDGRLQALKNLERYFSDNFYLAFHGEGTDFNALKRKDNPVAYKDMELEGMQAQGYFSSL